MACCALEAAQHLVAIGIVGDEIGDLGVLLEGVLGHRRSRHVRVQRLVEGEAAEILDLVDGVRLADRNVDDAARPSDLVDRELDGAGKRADDSVDLVSISSSSVRVAASPALSLSSRTSSSTLRPAMPPLSLISLTASSALLT
jgi:hypothetical protein